MKRHILPIIAALLAIPSAQAQTNLYVMQKKATEMSAIVPFADRVSHVGQTVNIYRGDQLLQSFQACDVASMSLSEQDTLRTRLIPEAYRHDFDYDIAFLDSDHLWTAEVEETDSTRNTYDDFLEHSLWDKAITITYGGSKASIDGTVEGVSIQILGNHVVVNSSATGVAYRLRGKSDDGSFKLYSERKSQVILDGITLTNPNGPALNSQSKRRLFLNIQGATPNTLTDGSTYTKVQGEDQRGCIFTEGKLCISGQGELYVHGNKKSAISSDDNIHIISGFIHADTHNEKSKSIYAQEHFIMGGGSLQVFCDGLAGKGIASDSLLTVKGGLIKVITTGDAIYEEEKQDYTSSCGIKCEYDMNLLAGDIHVLSCGAGGKGISAGHSYVNEAGKEVFLGELTVTSPRVWVRTAGARVPEIKEEDIHGNTTGAGTSPKGIKCASNVNINGGEIYVRCSGGNAAEGIESKKVFHINDGKIRTYCVDDGMNGEGAYIKGGDIFICSTANDGFDVSFLGLSGGSLYSIGAPVEQMGLDTDGKTFYISGGECIAIGANNCAPFGNANTQPSIMVYLHQNVRYLQLVDTQGQVIRTLLLPDHYINAVSDTGKVGKNIAILIGDAALQKGQTYRVLSYAKSLSDNPIQEYEFTVSTNHTTLGSFNKY